MERRRAYPYSQRLCLDLYAVHEPGRPLVVCVHGGGFISGSRRDERCQQSAEILVEAGFNCATVDYSLAPPENRFAAWPQNLADLADALAWLQQQASEFGYDFARLGLLGFSAGCCLSNLYILGGQRLFDQVGQPRPVFPVRAFAGFYGPYDFPSRQAARKSADPELNRVHSPSHWIRQAERQSVPPILHVQGDRDEIVYPQQHEMFRDDCAELGLDFRAREVPGFAHAFAPRDRSEDGMSIDLGPEIAEFFSCRL